MSHFGVLIPRNRGGGGGGDFSNAYRDKLDGIEARAQRNNPLVQKASLLYSDAASLAPSAFQAYDSGTALQSGDNLDTADTLRIAAKASIFGQDTDDLSTDLDAVDLTPFFRQIDGAGVFMALAPRGASTYTYMQAETATPVSSGSNTGYVLTNLSWVNPIALPADEQSFNLVMGVVTAGMMAKDIVGRFGPDVIALLEQDLLPEPEHVELTGWRFRGIDPTIDNLVTVPNANDIGEVNPNQVWANPSDANLTNVVRYMRRDHLFVVRKDASNYITYRVNQSIGSQGSDNERYFNFTDRTVVGTIAKDDTVTLQLTPAFVTNDRVDDTIPDTPTNIGVPTSKAVADYVADKAGDSSALLFDLSFTRTFVGDLSSTHAEAIVTEGTQAPNGAPSNATYFVGVDNHDSGGADQSADMDTVRVGDEMWVQRGDKYIRAKVLWVDEVVADYAHRFWFDPSEASADTFAYDDVGTGSGTVSFWRKGLTLHGTPVVTLSSVPEAGSSYSDMGTWAETDHVYVEGSVSNGTDTYRFTNSFLMSDVPASGDMWLSGAFPPTSGNRLNIRRKTGASTTLQISRSGPNVDAASVRAYRLN